jgi:hypothetical protein
MMIQIHLWKWIDNQITVQNLMVSSEVFEGLLKLVSEIETTEKFQLL